MKIVMEHLGNKIFVENEEAHDITDVFDLMEEALIQIGFDENRIKAGYLYKARQAEDEPS